MKTYIIRYICCILTTSLIVCAVLVNSFATEGNATYSISKANGNKGDTVSLEVTIDNNVSNGFSIGGFIINYDQSALSFNELEAHEDVTWNCYPMTEEADTGTLVTYIDLDFNPIEYSGKLFKITFTINDEAADGVYEIGLSRSTAGKNGGYWFADDNENDLGIVPEVSKGTITVGQGGSVTPSEDPSYTASFGYTVESIDLGNMFEVPVIITSESELAAAQLDLTCNPEVAKINKVTWGSGFTANEDYSVASNGDSARISFYGGAQDANSGLTVATITMQPVGEGNSSLKITNGLAAMEGRTGQKTMTVPSDPVVVNVVNSYKPGINEYVEVGGTDGVVHIITFNPETPLADGDAPFYNNIQMFKGGDDVWRCLVIGQAEETNIQIKQAANITTVLHPEQGTADQTSADLNYSGGVNIVDAQIAYDLATGKYTEIASELTDTSVDMLHWLMADVNGDDILDSKDARAIQVFIHTNEWFKDNTASA